MEEKRTLCVALGLGNNVDYEVEWDSAIIESLIEDHQIRDAELSGGRPVDTERDLVISILYWLRAGEGREIDVRDHQVIERFAQHFRYRVTMGGTGIRAALALHKLGVNSAIHLVTMNDVVRRCLPPGCAFVCSNAGESLYPHLIIQYRPGTAVDAGDIHICSNKANRLIYTNDPDNTLMKLSEDYAGLLGGARAFLISGFNIMRDASLLLERIDTLRHIMRALPPESIVFYECACYFQDDLNAAALNALRDVIDICSMNEEEFQQAVGRRVDLMDVMDMSGALEMLSATLGIPYLLVHSGQWGVIYGEGASKFQESLQSGMAMATARYRFGDAVGLAQYTDTLQLAPHPDSASFCTQLNTQLGNRACCCPIAQVPEIEVTTIGLGDAFVGGFMKPLAQTLLFA